MLCRRCSSSILSVFTGSRAISTTPRRLLPENPPAATSTSAAQPFSTPLTPSPTKTPNLPTGSSSSKDPKLPKSSLPAGAPLRGLSYLKGADPAVARDDDSYPPWLWTLLEPSSNAASKASGDSDGDAFAKSKKQRRLAAKAARAKTLNPHSAVHTVRVPLHEQSVDLPAGGREGTDARDELGAAMRAARRKKIKEQNFLKGMR